MIMSTKRLDVRINDHLFTTKAFRYEMTHVTIPGNHLIIFIHDQSMETPTGNKHIHLFHDNHLPLLAVRIIRRENVRDANFDSKR